MALLAEYALTPGVFDVTAYTSEEVYGLHLQALKDVLLHEGLVRNLRSGEWRSEVAGSIQTAVDNYFSNQLARLPM